MHLGLHFVMHLLRRACGERVTNFLLNPFFGSIDGSDQPGVPQPVYSMAEARCKQGRYLEARQILCDQLEKFPQDYRTHMMIAEIEAANLQDVAAAESVIQSLVAQGVHPPGSIFAALSTLADWHLKYGRDGDAAARCFEQVAALHPGSEWAIRAAQRIAHLPAYAMAVGNSAAGFNVPHVAADAGLVAGAVIAAQEAAPNSEAARLVKQLEDYPLDWEAREQLALIYARDYQRLDLAGSQLEQLIQLPNQPPKQVIRWLTMLVDHQVKFGGTYDAARAALERIIELNPRASAANVAQNRIQLLKLEFKGQEKSQAVTLGSYETDLGLKDRPGR